MEQKTKPLSNVLNGQKYHHSDKGNKELEDSYVSKIKESGHYVIFNYEHMHFTDLETADNLAAIFEIYRCCVCYAAHIVKNITHWLSLFHRINRI